MDKWAQYLHILSGSSHQPEDDRPFINRRRTRYYGRRVHTVTTRGVAVDFQHLNWQRDAACNGLNSELFFPEGPVDHAILRLCRSCPVATECLDHALTHGEHGIWAGTNERQRREILRARDNARARAAG